MAFSMLGIIQSKLQPRVKLPQSTVACRRTSLLRATVRLPRSFQNPIQLPQGM